MLLPNYFGASNIDTSADLAGYDPRTIGAGVDNSSRSLAMVYAAIRKAFEAAIDGQNLSDQLLGDGLIYSTQDTVNNTVDQFASVPRQMIVDIRDTTGFSHFLLQKDINNVTRGMQLKIDTSDTTYGNFKITDWTTGTNLFQVSGTTIATPLQFVSNLAVGTAPFAVTSTTLNVNLNADLLDGHDSTYFQTALTDAANIVYSDIANTYTVGKKQSVAADATYAGLNVGAAGSDPGTLSDGDLWGTTGRLKMRINGTTETFEVISNKNGASGYAGLTSSRIAKAQAPSTTVYTDASNTYSTGAQDFSSATSITGGNVIRNYTSQTATSAGTYNVAATIATIYVDASGLGVGQNYTVQLPSAVTYAGRTIDIKVIALGAATSTLTISSAAGNVEGAATDVLSVATGGTLKGATFQSNGTDWWIFGSKGLA